MREEAFRYYIEARVPKSAATYISDLRRIEHLYGNLDDKSAAELALIERSLRGDPSAPPSLPVTPKPSSRKQYATPLKHYQTFLALVPGEADIPLSTADEPPEPAYTVGVEGTLREARYLMRSRNRRLVDQARLRDQCRCRACGFHRRVGGRAIIEVHHLNPLGLAASVILTSVDDLVCLCPNCHRTIHGKSGEPYTLAELARLIGLPTLPGPANRRAPQGPS